LEYGIKLADAFDASVELVSVYKEIPMPVAEGVPVVYTTEVKQFTEQQLAIQAALFLGRLRVPVHTMAIEGRVTDSILAAAKEVGADMIIAGVKRSGKGIRRLFGDTLTALVRKSGIPVLVVPEGWVYCPPQGILLGDDIEADADAHTLDTLLEIGSVFNSKVYVARVIKRQLQEFLAIMQRPDAVVSLGDTLRVKYEYPVDQDVVHALSEFADKNAVQMIVMIPHPHFAPERWLIKGHTWSMIFRTKIPLLLLPGARDEK
jgi:nucleotide-binding universal stress UspA family protein